LVVSWTLTPAIKRNGGGDQQSRGERPTLQQRPDTGVKEAKRMRNNKADMQESAGVLGV